jgi:tetratricopeptide (TPR) repeat protein
MHLAEAAGHPLSMTGVCNNAGLVYIEQGAFEEARIVLERGVALAEASDLPFRSRLMRGHLGLVYAHLGRHDEGVMLLERSMEEFASMGHPAYQSLRAGWLADGYVLAGRPGDGQRLAEQAFDLGVTYGEWGHQARALRVLADIYADPERSASDEAEARYRQALGIAEELGMRPLEARCRLGLGKLYRRLGRGEEARTELTTAVTMLREMGMAFWLPEAEAELAATS